MITLKAWVYSWSSVLSDIILSSLRLFKKTRTNSNKGFTIWFVIKPTLVLFPNNALSLHSKFNPKL